MSSNRMLLVLLSILALVGFFIRVSGIGSAPLSVDEYYTVKSVQNILKYGLPQFDTGGYYTRGILFQYVLAFSSFVSGLRPEVIFRFVNIIFNLLMLPAVFLLSKKAYNRHVAFAAFFLSVFSLWEIEFARFIRMYVLFQTIFVWYAYLVYLILVEKEYRQMKWAYLLSFLSIFVYEGAILLVAFNFLPLLLRKELSRRANIVVSVILLVLAYFFLTTDFRHMGVQNYLPVDMAQSAASSAPIMVPVPLLFSLAREPVWLALLLIFSLPVALFIKSALGNPQLSSYLRISIIVLLLLAYLNLFGLMLGVFLLLMLANWITLNWLFSSSGKKLVLISLMLFLFWVLYINLSDSWRYFLASIDLGMVRESLIQQLQLKEVKDLLASFSLQKELFLLFNYPNLFRRILRPWMEGLPIFTLLTGSLFGAQLAVVLVKNRNGKPNEFSGVAALSWMVLVFALAVATVNTPYNSTRYTFFLYPIILLLNAGFIYQMVQFVVRTKQVLVSSLAYSSLLFAFLLVSEDFSFDHLVNVNKPEYMLRMAYHDKRAAHFYSRMDAISPANYVNDHLGTNDIVITDFLPINYYLKKLDYFYASCNPKILSIISAQGGKKEVWSNAGLIYKPEQLENAIKGQKSVVWLILSSHNSGPEAEESYLSQRFKAALAYCSVDEKIKVYKVMKELQ